MNSAKTLYVVLATTGLIAATVATFLVLARALEHTELFLR